MPLKIYNSLTRQREEFRPLNPPRVGMYVCGPTVYSHSHLGHAKSYVSFDVVVRWLRLSGWTVNYIQNITDVGHIVDEADEGEDKVVAEARRRGLHPMAVVETFLRSFLDDMDALNVVRPDIMPRATGHIPEQIELARRLIETGHAYEVNGSVYFSVHSFPGYGKLSGRTVEELEAGARVEVNPDKRHPADFALWKRADPGHIMRWPSPWGEGYPGWHLECSAMSMKYLGETFDIHGGGMDNKFPHHECEIAQSEAATGKPFVRIWMHNNMCTIQGQKMSKSLGNSVTIKDAIADGHPLLGRTFEPVVLRHFILTSHYRSPLDFSAEALQAAESGSFRLRDAARRIARGAREAPGNPGDPVPDSVRAALADIDSRFAAAMDEDFNTPAAVAVLFDLARLAAEWSSAGIGRAGWIAADALMQRLAGQALGFKWSAPSAEADEAQRNALIRILVDLRNQARASGDFPQADRIRARLAELGIELRDTPQGTVW